jgi:hypothetical protein
MRATRSARALELSTGACTLLGVKHTYWDKDNESLSLNWELRWEPREVLEPSCCDALANPTEGAAIADRATVGVVAAAI